MLGGVERLDETLGCEPFEGGVERANGDHEVAIGIFGDLLTDVIELVASATFETRAE